MAFIYLASPYSDKSRTVRHGRYLQVAETTAELLRQGLHVYSPIVHCHELAERHNLPKDFAFWEKYNFAMLEQASALHILELEGWEQSKGVRGEIQFAVKTGITIQRLTYPLMEAVGG